MSEFLRTSELTETKAFVRSFVKEVLVRRGNDHLHAPHAGGQPHRGSGRRRNRPGGGVRGVGFGGGGEGD